jgi:hypothetical protein
MVKFPFYLYWTRQHSTQESKSDFARKSYAILKREVLENALSHPDCPLTPDDIRMIRAKIKKLERKDRILHFLSKANKVIRV